MNELIKHFPKLHRKSLCCKRLVLRYSPKQLKEISQGKRYRSDVREWITNLKYLKKCFNGIDRHLYIYKCKLLKNDRCSVYDKRCQTCKIFEKNDCINMGYAQYCSSRLYCTAWIKTEDLQV